MATKKTEKKQDEGSKALAKLKESEKEIVVKTHDDYLFATKELFKVKEQLNEWTQHKEDFTEPAKEIIAKAKEKFGGVIKYLEEREARIKNLVSAYLVECEEKRLKQLRSAQQVGKVNQAKGRELIATAEQQTPPKVSGIAVTPSMSYEIFDEAQVPDEYFKMVRVLDTEKLEAALEEGDVPGVLIKAKVGIRVTVSQQEG